MPDDGGWQGHGGWSPACRGWRAALLVVTVVVAAGLLGRFGVSGLDGTPDGGDDGALQVERRPVAPAPQTGGPTAAEERAWRRLPDPGLAAREAHTAVWTGDAVLVWGGYGPFGSGHGLHPDGAAFDVASATWRPVPPAPLPGLVNHTAVWSGREMIVWSGAATGDRGAAYDPATGAWRRIAADPLPERHAHTAVWAGPAGHGGEMLVWGGHGREPGPQGAAYDPAADAWRTLPEAPDAAGVDTRYGHTATWTGREMVVVGGTSGRSLQATALAYDPSADTWRVLPEPPGGAREAHTATWTGEELLVWGGAGHGGAPARPAGLSYDPDADAWTALPDPPDGPREGHAAAWAGDAMVVWGGIGPRDERPAALAYDPAARTWRALAEPPRPPRAPARLLWTGGQLIVVDGVSAMLASTPPDGR